MRLLIDRELFLKINNDEPNGEEGATIYLSDEKEFHHGIGQRIGVRLDVTEFLQHCSIERAIDLFQRDLSRIVHINQRAMP